MFYAVSPAQRGMAYSLFWCPKIRKSNYFFMVDTSYAMHFMHKEINNLQRYFKSFSDIIFI